MSVGNLDSRGVDFGTLVLGLQNGSESSAALLGSDDREFPPRVPGVGESSEHLHVHRGLLRL